MVDASNTNAWQLTERLEAPASGINTPTCSATRVSPATRDEHRGEKSHRTDSYCIDISLAAVAAAMQCKLRGLGHT